ncbi:hypothetical protein JRO89_XS05G0107100 [Xanthoceras sorbifolium]|uniref:Peptidase M3A/M3B catalytic domain-containing protein n=1 Tax=Xanthoceras sorbifolium TaxID=99658 RepID=A0ABQ8I1D1_9ROSI|nr:hypothetical protein JRO89_XS05G0107100 [Xanthoceras sorbifolium]
MENETNGKKMSEQKRERNLLAFTGATALAVVAVNLAIAAFNSHRRKPKKKKKDLKGSNVRVNLSASEILKLADRIIAKSKEVHDAVASVPLDKLNSDYYVVDLVTYMNVISPLAELEAQQSPLVESCVFPRMVSTSDDVRKASVEAGQRIDAHLLSCRMRDDVYRVVKTFAARGEWMTPEAKRYIQSLVRDFERNGSNLTLTKREELQRLRTQINELSLHYVQNLNDDSTFLLFTEAELLGLPSQLLESLDKSESGKFKVTLKSHLIANVLELCKRCGSGGECATGGAIVGGGATSLRRYAIGAGGATRGSTGTALRCEFHWFVTGALIKSDSFRDASPIVLANCNCYDNLVKSMSVLQEWMIRVVEDSVVGTTRRLVAVAYGKMCGELNLSVLESLVELRHKVARLLGYSNYADYSVDLRMAKTSSKVFEFLEELSASLTDMAARELMVLKDLKKQEEGELPFGIEDLRYYLKRVEEQQFDLDFGAVKQYFPVSLVLSGIFKISQDLFGLRFEEVADTEVWHNDVQVFSVFDLSSNELLGYFYLDIYKREGKYGHTCVAALQNGALSSTGARQIPVALLVSQIQKDIVGHPGLLRFPEVVKLFHEFCHVVQHICNRASFARFSGLHVDPDFFEIPAHLLENWCYESFSLKLISGFHQDITRPITDEVCKSLKKWRYAFSALKLKQEILYCIFDQIVHSADNIDIVELFRHLHPKVMLGLPMLEGTNPASCCLRSAIGFEAVCYGDIWSKVFAADIFASKFHDDGLLDQYVGMQFRNKVMAPGGSKEPIEILSDFLGRAPSIQAFVDRRAGYGL